MIDHGPGEPRPPKSAPVAAAASDTAAGDDLIEALYRQRALYEALSVRPEMIALLAVNPEVSLEQLAAVGGLSLMATRRAVDAMAQAGVVEKGRFPRADRGGPLVSVRLDVRRIASQLGVMAILLRDAADAANAARAAGGEP